MKKVLLLVLCVFMGFNSFGQITSSKDANKRTALRYLSLAKNYLNNKDYQSALKATSSGLSYDDSVSDLWYLKAVCMFNSSCARYEILPVIENSIKINQWVDYNMTNARVFYADMLCSTGRADEALSVLDENPLVLNSDAEYIRVKSYYQKGDLKSLDKARARIDSARRVYPNDVRFFYIFFNYEYNLLYTKSEDGKTYIKAQPDELTQKIAASFIRNVPIYDKSLKDLELFAAAFATGEERNRLLKAFNARGFKHILYPLNALEAGVLSQQEALDYFEEFIKGDIDAKLLSIMYSSITDENLRKYFDQILNAFEGTLLYDTSNNLEANLIAEYERGRAKRILYDNNNDGFTDWEALCDFGSPKSLAVYSQKAAVEYFNYPDCTKITFVDLADDFPPGDTVYSVIDNSVAVKPFDIIKESIVTGTDFFVPDPDSIVWGRELFDADKIVMSCNEVEHPSWERPGARVHFKLLDSGRPHSADYYVDGRVYAHADFLSQDTQNQADNGVVIVRNVDLNGDGNLEVTQYYSLCQSGQKIDRKDMDALTTAIWGAPVKDAALYLSRVEIDSDYNTVCDYVQTVDPDGKVVTYWDKDEDGNWEICSEKFPLQEGEPLQTVDHYKIVDVVKGKVEIIINKKNNVPVLLKSIWKDSDDQEITGEYPVQKGTVENIYWVGDKGSEGQEKNILGMMNESVQGQVFSVEEPDHFLHVIEMGSLIFVRKVIKTDLSSKAQILGEEAL